MTEIEKVEQMIEECKDTINVLADTCKWEDQHAMWTAQSLHDSAALAAQVTYLEELELGLIAMKRGSL